MSASHLPLIPVAVGGRYSLDRAALAALLERLPGLHVVPLDAFPPPRILVWACDPQLPDELPALASETALLLVVGGDVEPGLLSGAAGLFSKDEPLEVLGAAIRQVARGEQYLSASLALALLKRPPAGLSATDFDPGTLTEREREVLVLLGDGLSNKAIAARLYLSVRTVEGHLANLYTRLGVHSRIEAVLIAMQSGLASPIK